MKHVTELLTPQTIIGSIEAHDDDYISKGHIETATIGRPKHLLTLVEKSLGSKDYQPSSTNVQAGGRAAEGQAGAELLGYQTFTRMNAVDGSVAMHESQLAVEAAAWIRRHNVNLLLSTRRLDEHEDHVAAGRIALRAAQTVALEDRRNIGILEVHPTYKTPGDYIAEATPESIAQLHRAAAKNVSQFRYASPEETDENFILVAPDLALHQQDYDELGLYPIEANSTYSYTRVGGLVLAQTAKLVTT